MPPFSCDPAPRITTPLVEMVKVLVTVYSPASSSTAPRKPSGPTGRAETVVDGVLDPCRVIGRPSRLSNDRRRNKRDRHAPALVARLGKVGDRC